MAIEIVDLLIKMGTFPSNMMIFPLKWWFSIVMVSLPEGKLQSSVNMFLDSAFQGQKRERPLSISGCNGCQGIDT